MLLTMIKNKLIYEFEKIIIKLNSLHKKIVRQPNVASMSETIRLIKDNRASIARYGDGEFDIIFGRTQGFQGKNRELAKRLKQILKYNNISEKFLVGIPDCFDKLEQFTPEAQLHWKIRLDKERYKWIGCLNTKFTYYNSQITRFYFDWSDKSKCCLWFEQLKDIWNDENIIIVEGDKSRVGVGNDLFDNAKSIKRIICPSENAFDKYDKILESITQIADKSNLIIIALGPTATILAYDLFKLGFWAFDAGHIDIEYEWMINNATEKIIVPGKYINEVKNGNIVQDISDEVYKSQITKLIK